MLGVGGASTTLAQVTVRDERDHVLDLGTGCGIQALHASRHSRRVVGTDISRRALAFARFNAALAGVDARSARGVDARARRRRAVRPRREQPAVRHHAPDAGDAVVRVPRRRPFRGRDRARARRGRRRGAGARRRGAAAGQLGGAARRGVARARRVLARRLRAGRVGGPARAAGPRAVRRDVDPRRRHDARPRPGRVGRPLRAVAGRLRVAGRRGHRVRLRDPAQAARRADAAPAGGGHRDGPAAARAGRSRPRSPRTTGSR